MRALSLTRAAAHASPTHIYVVATSDGVVKVGRTSNPRARLTTLRSQSRAAGLQITEAWVSRHTDAKHAEAHLRYLGRQMFELVTLERFRATHSAFMATVREYFASNDLDLGVEESLT